jgi:hypothetical protein
VTHDELLAELDKSIKGAEFEERWTWTTNAKALRAVVELHKPDYEWGNCMGCQETDGGWFENCPTIQAIKKELK